MQSKPGVYDSQRPKFEPLDIKFLDRGFYNEKGCLKQEILDQEAKKLAQRFGPKGGFDKVSSAQIRRFFGDVRELEHTLVVKNKVNLKSDDPTNMEKHMAIVKMLKSKLAYSAGRGVISKSFSDTLSRAIDQINTPRDFKAFVLFFESIVGYYYGEGGGKIK